MIEKYKIQIVDNFNKSLTFGEGALPNDVEVTVIKDMSQGVYTADVSIFGLSSDTFKVLSYSNLQPPIRQIKITVLNNGSENVVFHGVVSGTPSFDPVDLSLNLQATNYFINRSVQVTMPAGATFLSIKRAFATSLNLRLSSDNINDAKTNNEPYVYNGAGVLTELRRLFPDEYVYIASGLLCFTSKTQKKTVGNVVAFDITRHIIKPSYSDGINSISCLCLFLPYINPNDVCVVNFGQDYNAFFRNLNGRYFVRRTQNDFACSNFDKNDATTTLDLQSFKNIARI